VNNLPLHRFRAVCVTLKAVVRVKTIVTGQDRHRIRIGEWIRLDDPNFFADPCSALLGVKLEVL
jgi:hypothetical protein